MDLRQLFATNLRRIRHQRKLSPEQLAHDAGMDRVYVSRVERGRYLRGVRNHREVGLHPRGRSGRVLPAA
jgi:ribosome-binding protein aMBF1 (putative translation factor)